MLNEKRELGLFSTVIMGLSGAIGFEIFVLLDYAYFHLAGPNIVLALLLAGLINLLIMFSYCELSAVMPKVGGEYTYVKIAYGGFVAFISGCYRWFASVVGAALAAISFTRQLAYLFSIVTPKVHGFIMAQTQLIAVIIVMVFAALEIRGVKRLGSIVVAAFLAIFAIFIARGLLRGPTTLEIFPKHLPEDLSGVFAAAVYMFPMFFGMRALVAGAHKIKDPKKNIPRGILLSALPVIPLYCIVAYVAVGAVPLGEYDKPFLNLAAENIMPGVGGLLFAFAGMVASLSALGTSLAVQSSIAGGMSRDGYLPKLLLSVHQRFGTPFIAIAAGSLIVMFLSAIGDIEFLGYSASFGSLLVFALVSLSLLKLRKEEPYIKRPFKTPFYPFTPIAGIVMPIALMAFLMFMGDVNAASALMSCIGLTGSALLIYYLIMLGRYRLQIATGGASIGAGIFLASMTLIAEAGFISPIFPNMPMYITLSISAVSIISGILNFIVRVEKGKFSKIRNVSR